MRQRLGIAAALMRKPRLLLLDEPATGLDPAGMRDMRDLVRRLAGEGITVLLSSHLLDGGRGALQPGRDHPQGQRSSTRAGSTSCSPPRPAGYRLRAIEPERARVVCLAQRGVEEVALDGGDFASRAAEEAVASLSSRSAQAASRSPRSCRRRRASRSSSSG